MASFTKIEIENLKKREKQACQDLYDKCKNVFFGICLRYSRTREDAQDILQNGFVEIFNALESYNFKGSFEGWMKKIMVRQAIAFVKKNYKHRYNEVEENIATTHANIFDKFSEESLLSIIKSIPDQYQVIFNMRAVEEYSSKEVSDLLDINEATVRSQYHRAKKLIQSAINKLDESEKHIINYGD